MQCYKALLVVPHVLVSIKMELPRYSVPSLNALCFNLLKVPSEHGEYQNTLSQCASRHTIVSLFYHQIYGDTATSQSIDELEAAQRYCVQVQHILHDEPYGLARCSRCETIRASGKNVCCYGYPTGLCCGFRQCQGFTVDLSIVLYSVFEKKCASKLSQTTPNEQRSSQAWQLPSAWSSWYQRLPICPSSTRGKSNSF